MNPARSIRSRATALWRALSVLSVVAGAVTCDSSTSPGHRVSLLVAPVFGRLSMSGFSGMAVDSVRLTVVRPPSDTIARQTLAFSPDSASIQTNITVDLNSSHEQLLVLIQFLSNSQVVFTGSETVDVVAGTTTPAPAQVPITYIGPGKSIAAIHITPRDSGAVFGSAVPFVITATDSSNANVPQFYVSWSTTRTGDTINAAGVFRPGATRGVAWVRARTPTGIWDSVRIMIAPVASQMAIVSGDHQSAAVSQALPLPFVVQVKAADNLPVVGVPVQFAAVSGGGSVSPASGVTDTLGQAHATATLGSAVGTQTFTASATGLTSVTFSATATTSNFLTTITVAPGFSVLFPGGTVPLVVTGKDAGGALVTVSGLAFVSRSPAVATVDATTGLVTGVAGGTAVVVASATGASGTVFDSMAVAVAGTGAAVASAIGDGRAFDIVKPGDTVRVLVQVDLRRIAPDKLGSYLDTLRWNTTALTYVRTDVLAPSFGPAINEGATASGQLIFGGADPNGVAGPSVTLVRVVFVGNAVGTSTLTMKVAGLSGISPSFNRYETTALVYSGAVRVQ